MRRKHAVVAVQMPARRWDEARQPVDIFGIAIIKTLAVLVIIAAYYLTGWV